MQPDQFQKEIAALQVMIAERYGIGGQTLAIQIKRLGRALPRYERGQARVLIEAETALQHPKMAMRVQVQPFQHAMTALKMHLEGVDPGHRRRGVLLSITATVMVNVALAIALLAALYVWLRA